MITKLNLQKGSWLLRKKDVLNSDMRFFLQFHIRLVDTY